MKNVYFLNFDANEGRYVEMGCLECKEDVRTEYGPAGTARMYLASFSCPGCGTELVQFDAFTRVVAA